MSWRDKQEGGDHYKKLAIEPAEFVHANGIGFLAGTAIKYLSRHHLKNGAEDVRKAIHYCEMLLEMVYSKKADLPILVERVVGAVLEAAKTPHPERDLASEYGDLLAAKDTKITSLERRVKELEKTPHPERDLAYDVAHTCGDLLAAKDTKITSLELRVKELEKSLELARTDNQNCRELLDQDESDDVDLQQGTLEPEPCDRFVILCAACEKGFDPDAAPHGYTGMGFALCPDCSHRQLSMGFRKHRDVLAHEERTGHTVLWDKTLNAWRCAEGDCNYSLSSRPKETPRDA